MEYLHLKSAKIKVFPFGSNRVTNPVDRVLNEQNLTQIIKSVTDYDSYVISYEGNLIKFVINGYYVEADLTDLKDKPLYASITMEGEDYNYLNGGDNLTTVKEGSLEAESEFTGVNFANSLEHVGGTHQLQLLDNNGNVPVTSLYKISGESIHIDRIYCGTSTILID